MDEGDEQDLATFNRPEDTQSQGKESRIFDESCNPKDSQERFILREEDKPKCSFQEFEDILGGKDALTTVNVVGTSQNPCPSDMENEEGRMQELVLGPYGAGNNAIHEGEMMEAILNGWQHENQLRNGNDLENSHEQPTKKENYPIIMKPSEDLRSGDISTGQPSDQNANVESDQSTYDRVATISQSMLPTEGTRMKIISKPFGSGFPAFFAKSTLKGKGFVYSGPVSAGAEIMDRNTVKVAATPSTFSGPPVNNINQTNPTNLTRSSPPVIAREKSATLHTDYTAVLDDLDLDPGQKSGVTMRKWMKLGQGNMHKVDTLLIFRDIVDVVYSLHSDGKVLVDLRPSCFRLLPSKKVSYCGRISLRTERQGTVKQKEIQKAQALKRPFEQGRLPYLNMGAKYQKSTDNANFLKIKSQFLPECGVTPVKNGTDGNLAGPGKSSFEQDHSNPESKTRAYSSSAQQHASSAVDLFEKKWYRSPEENLGRGRTCSSNIYCLGVFLFELLSSFDSGKVHAAVMSDLHHRILPPDFLSENPREAGFCLWLLHPEPSHRPTAGDILQSEVVIGLQSPCVDESSSSICQDEGESELLLNFLVSMEEQKKKDVLKSVEDLGCIQVDVKELEKRYLSMKSACVSCSQEDIPYITEHSGDGFLKSICGTRDPRLLKNVAQLESAYFLMRSQTQVSDCDTLIRPFKDVLKIRETWFLDKMNEEKQGLNDSRGDFFDGLCKYARYSKLEVCGTVRHGDITNSTNVICSLSFDRDESYFAAAGVSKKIKIFDFQSLCDDSVDIHYPVIEMSNRSKLSSVCWNNYITNFLASTDYDGTVKLWDTSTGQGFSQYTEHEKRAWSVDFSQLDPTRFASGSDDCSVRLWNINERRCLHTIRNIANVCCVQFSPHSSHLLAFGSADYKIYCYDLRNANIPWCVLGGHEKAVSYVKFVDSETLVSASTDNTLKLWDLKRSSSNGLSNNACSLTFTGHTNEKNFVGLSVAEGYITCGSETNEVYTYYKSLPMPIISHKFGSIDPISGKETENDCGEFVSSVCWKGNSNMLVSANSNGYIKVLRMV